MIKQNRQARGNTRGKVIGSPNSVSFLGDLECLTKFHGNPFHEVFHSVKFKWWTFSFDDLYLKTTKRESELFSTSYRCGIIYTHNLWPSIVWFFFHSFSSSASMKTLWLSLSDGTLQRQIIDISIDRNNLSITERSLSGPSYGEVMPHILTLIMFSVCPSTQKDWWLREEEKHRTRVRSNLKIDSEANAFMSVIADHMNV